MTIYSQEISPGIVETNFSETMWGDAAKAKETYSSLKCLKAEDIAASVIHAISAPLHVNVSKYKSYYETTDFKL